MINASANKVAKSYCGVATQGCVSFTEIHEESNDMYGKKIKAEDSAKEKMCLPVDVMTLLAYQAKGNERVERYLTKHGFKYEGRFVPEDLNPEFYFQKKYCKGCTVNKKGEVGIKKEKEYVRSPACGNDCFCSAFCGYGNHDFPGIYASGISACRAVFCL